VTAKPDAVRTPARPASAPRVQPAVTLPAETPPSVGPPVAAAASPGGLEQPAAKQGEPEDQKDLSATAIAAQITGDARRTHFSLELSRPVPYNIFKMAKPYRVVIDMPVVDFRLLATAGQKGGGLIHAYHYGLFAPGKSRVVIHATSAVRVENRVMTGRAGGKPARLSFDLVRTDPRSFVADAAPALAPRPTKRRPNDARGKRRPPNAKRVVVIDPGHGGPEPGAVWNGVREKDVALAVALKVHQALEATGRYELHMTRSTDVFISLDGRVEFSQSKGAELFVSIHADSVPTADRAAVVRGATVYTLSEEASNPEAQRLAEKENAADILAGVEAGEDNGVQGVLSVLQWREATGDSSEFRSRLLTRLKGTITLSPKPARSANFRVLRQDDSPSVLFELGYISNVQDAKLLVSPDWQQRVADSIATAIGDYFDKRSARRH
jgi:N-acetylmuramoyl-L-alanine amidase